ncbi:MAG: hypothetical protein GY844_04235 [Bradyrhizobium sp.]|nr:hypothetical protein [Bradyrhizobium sp.]
MTDENLARLSAHRQNIGRYRQLLETDLAVAERDFIERRLAEEEAAVGYLDPRRPFRTRNGQRKRPRAESWVTGPQAFKSWSGV